MGGNGDSSPAEGEAEVFGPYEICERLGVGGMATVHRALERGIAGFQREVALKRLLPELAQDDEFVASFVREAKLAAHLSHPNIVQIFELGRVGPTYFISMEYIPGSDLRRVLRQARRSAGPPPLKVTVSLLFELCDALDYAHLRRDEDGEPLGLIHRDISPSNLLVSAGGHLKIIDFGLAKATTAQHRTRSGRRKGKLAYMAPETLARAEIDSRADIFSAGAIAHELLTARQLFAAPTDYEMIERIRKGRIAPPGEVNAAVPEELDALVLKALARAPKERWQSAAAMRAALEEIAIRHNLHATNLEVVEWIRWALSESGQDGEVASGSFPTETGSPGLDLAQAPVESFLEQTPNGREEERSVDQIDDKPTVVDLSALGARKLTEEERERAETDVEGVKEEESGTAKTAPVPARKLEERAEGKEAERDGKTETRTKRVPARPGRDWEDATTREKEGRGEGGGIDQDQVGVPKGSKDWEDGPTLLRARRKKPISGPATSRQSVPPIPTGRGPRSAVTFRDRPKEGVRAEAKDDAPAPRAFSAEEGRRGAERAKAPSVSKSGRLRLWLAGAAALILSVTAGFSAGLHFGAGPGSEPATLAIESSPPGLTAELDGEPLERKTPVVVEVEPGPHTVTLSDGSGLVWEGEIEAKAGARYDLRPVLVRP